MEPAPVKIRILIVDDQLVVREGLRMLIENHPGTKVVAMASTRSEALDMLARETCDLIILDLELGGYSATSFIPQLRDAARTARVLVLTGSRDSAIHQKAAQLGAMGVVLKEDAADLLLKAIEKVYRGEAWLDRVTLGTLLFQMSNQDKESIDPRVKKISTLTDRERQVIALIAEGNAHLYKRPGLTFRPVADLAPAELAIAWRRNDPRDIIHAFVNSVDSA